MNGPATPTLGGMRRKPIRLDEDALVTFKPLNDGQNYTLLCEPAGPGVSLIA